MAPLPDDLPAPKAQACTVQPAQANDDYWTTSKNTSITASPLANDPDTNFVGTDSFNYTYRGCLQCFNGWCSEPDFDIGTVHITVTE